MARGPFQGTFQPNARPTVATAPDAVVYINGETEIAGCPQCSRTFDVNKYVTSIQTDLSVDSVPGSANISLSIPRHSVDDFYFDGNPVITTMMEVEIFVKGNYLVEGLPQYYPIFWGLITEVQDNYSGGEHTVSLHCADILKWWELCKTNINPAALGQPGDQGRNLLGNVFASQNAYDIIFTLATQSFGDVLVGTGSIQNLIRDTAETSAALTDMTLYWERRFSKMRSNLVLYGTTGVAVRGDTLFQGYSKNPSANQYIASTTIRDAEGSLGGQMVYDPADEKMTGIKVDYGSGGPGLLQHEYQTKLEIANAMKEAVGFEFYMDSTGDIVFKPPFYNLDVLGNKPVSWIQDIDVIDWDFSESESEVVTQLVMEGQYSTQTALSLDPSVLPKATVTDYHLLRKYGWRVQSYNAEFATNPIELFYHGLDVLDRINARRYRGNVTIPIRPELRLGFPVYVAPKDEIWYVSGISHSLSFGGRATTTLQLTSRRTKFIAPKGIGTLKLASYGGKDVTETSRDGGPAAFPYSSRQLSNYGVFELKRDGALEIPGSQSEFESVGAANPVQPLILRHPKTGRIVGYPNVVMVYSRPFDASDVNAVIGQQTNQEAIARLPQEGQAAAKRNREILEGKQREQLTPGKDSEIRGKYTYQAYQYGMNAAGVFIYAYDASKVIREAVAVKTANVTPQADANARLKEPHTFIRPVSDERGFELIGHYRYGRRVSLRDGRLIVNKPGEKAKVDVQLALSGDLSSMLAAQSQGLTTVVTGYADPAAELAEMSPEDGQTAAVVPGVENSPNKKSAEFTSVGDEFVDEAPLGSVEQRGVMRDVEASQLSRALTLAEMSVLDNTIVRNEDCACITGRADLAFMASGYQVESLNASSVDLGALGDRLQYGTTVGAQVKEREREYAELLGQAEALWDSLLESASVERPDQAEIKASKASQRDLDVKLAASARQLADARQKYAQETGGPIQVVSDDALDERVTAAQIALNAERARLAELQKQAPQAKGETWVKERIGVLEASIKSSNARINSLTEAQIAEPEQQQQLGEELADVMQSLKADEKELEHLRSTASQEMNQVASKRAEQNVASLEKQLAAAQAELKAHRSTRGASSGSILNFSNAQVVSKVESFLYKLYRSLDDAHQEFEKSIRGERMDTTNVTFKDIHQPGVSVATQHAGSIDGPDVAPVSEFAPPFSAPGRYQLGDPNASVGVIDTTRSDVAKAWSDFSRNLQQNTRNRMLTTQIGQDRASIARLTAARDLLIKQRDSAKVVGDIQKQIDSMSTQIAHLERQVSENQGKLNEGR